MLGKSQSPIDLSGAVEQDAPDIEYYYDTTNLNIVNNGHTVQVNYDPGSSINIDGTDYGLVQFHFHTPSEHTIDGRSYDGEMHLVHKSSEGELAVVSVLLEKGDVNESLNPIIDNMPTKEGDTADVMGGISVDDLLPKDRSAYRYTGSLTTPPCSEDVKWIVLKTPVQISEAQLEALQKILKDNNRPVQPLNSRKVIYTPVVQ